MKTTIDILFRLFAEYTGKNVPSKFRMPFSIKGTLIMNHMNVSDLIMVLEVKGDATALNESKPSTSTIRRTASLKIFKKRALRKTGRFAFNRIEPFLNIGAIEYRDNDERPSEMEVTDGKVKLVPGSKTNLTWVVPCRKIRDMAYRYHEKFQNEVVEIPAATSK